MTQTPQAQCDMFISGGGVAGLTAAALFGSMGLRVICVDPTPPITNPTQNGADLRTTAILQPGRDLWQMAGLWDRLAPHGMPLETMRIADASTNPPLSRDFNADELSDEPFGWNFPNWLLRREISGRLEALETVDFRPGTGFASMVSRDSEALVRLSCGASLRTRLVLACDGRDSPVRQAAGIGTQTIRYGQKAIVFAVTHPAPHDCVSTEIHQSQGPFTLVPLPDHEGAPCSAVVWIVSGAEALRLAKLDPAAFAAEATDRAAGLYGALQLIGTRQIWPIIAQHADRMTARRVALAAEAAHVVPPIGAQGLNMSLADLACLRDLIAAAPDDLGSARQLDQYQRRRFPEVLTRIRGIDLLNRSSRASGDLAHALRSRGIALIHGAVPIRRALMQLGLGTAGKTSA